MKYLLILLALFILPFIGHTQNNTQYLGIPGQTVLARGNFNTVGSLFGGVTTPFVQKTILINGTSVVFGTGATNNARRWSTMAAGFMLNTEGNLGHAGATLSHPAPSAINSEVTTYLASDVVTYNAALYTYVLLAWGENDALYMSTVPADSFTVHQYLTDYQTVINAWLAAGWPASKIIIVSNVNQIVPAVGQIYQDSIFNANDTIAVRNGLSFVDIYHPLQAYGTSMKNDYVHPDDQGHAYIAALTTQTLDAANQVFSNGQQGGVNGKLETQYLYVRSPDTAASNAMVAARNPDGRITFFPMDRYPRYYGQGLPPSVYQQGSLFFAGQISLSGNTSLIQTAGGGNFGSFPSVSALLQTGVTLGMLGGNGWVDAISPAGAEQPLALSGLGAHTGIGNTPGAKALAVSLGSVTQLYGGTYVEKYIAIDSSTINDSKPYKISTNGNHIYWQDHRGVSYQLEKSDTSVDVTGKTTVQTLLTRTLDASNHTFSFAGYLNVSAVTTDVMQMQVVYTDENSVSQTAIFYNLGATVPGIGTVSNSTFPAIQNIRVLAGSTITVSTVLTTTGGTITYDAGATLTQIR